MDVREVGRNGLKVSALGLGCMGMSEFYGGRDEAEAVATIHRAIELGVTFLDTADMYGPFTNEVLVGKAIAGRRDQVVLATKFANVRGENGEYLGIRGDPKYVRQACDASLRRLGVDHIDLYYQHRVDPNTPIEETVGAMAGKPTLWLELRSSNGFHASAADERTSPRAWYESNNLVGVVAQLAEGLNGALTYTIKASPNGVSDTTHELSISGSFKKDGGLGVLRPGFAATWRPKGGGGVYRQATIEPGWSLGAGDSAPRLSFPAALGVGWDSFYDPGSGSRLFGSVGAALEHPFTIGSAHLSARAEALALIRDNRLRRLGEPTADHQSVRPYVTLSVTYAY